MSQCGPDCLCGKKSDELKKQIEKKPITLPSLEMSEEEIERIRPNRAYRRSHKKCKCKGLGLVRVKNKLEVCYEEVK